MPAAPAPEARPATATQENTAGPAAPAATPAPAPAAAAAPAPAPAAKARAAESAAEAAPAGALPNPSTLRDSAPAGTRPSAARLATATADPLAAPLAALTDAADASWRERLLTLRRQAQGRWLRTEGLPAGAGEVVLDASGRALGRLLQQPGRVVWQGDDGLAWQALLSAAASPSAPAASH
ncbi:MAG: hypothetical protein RJA10_1764 [Pseudomonadota bacterium]|jgi:hypothetical protein